MPRISRSEARSFITGEDSVGPIMALQVMQKILNRIVLRGIW